MSKRNIFLIILGFAFITTPAFAEEKKTTKPLSVEGEKLAEELLTKKGFAKLYNSAPFEANRFQVFSVHLPYTSEEAEERRRVVTEVVPYATKLGETQLTQSLPDIIYPKEKRVTLLVDTATGLVWQLYKEPTKGENTFMLLNVEFIFIYPRFANE